MSIGANNILKRYIAEQLSEEEVLETLLPHDDESSELLISCRPDSYSASEIAHAVEDCDSKLLALSVTAMRDTHNHPVMMLKVNTRTPDGVARSLARYGYETIHTRSRASHHEQSQAMERINELLHILEI